MFRSGAFVGEHVEPVDAAQIQPNGVDLTIESVLEPIEPGWIGTDGKSIGDRRPVPTTETADGAAAFELDPGGWVVQYAERVRIPDGTVGFLLPRSSLMRNGTMVHTAVWDAGYEGRGEGLLSVHHPIVIESGARIAQLVLANADHTGTYAGSYHGERTGGE